MKKERKSDKTIYRKKEARKAAAKKIAKLSKPAIDKKVREVNLKEAYEDFIHWCILNDHERKQMKEPKDQKAFAQKWEINEDTITDWKKRDDFPKLRADAFRAKLSMETPNVIGDLRKRIKRYGSGLDVELWLAYAEQWDRKQVIEMKQPLQFGLGDIRALIVNLPKEKQKQYYQTLGRLIADAKDAEENGRAK